MPIYQYSCIKTGEVFEEILPISEWDRRLIICRIHFNRDNYLATGICHDAEKIWSIPGNIQIGKPTRIFVDSKGNTFSPISQHDKPPKGYREIELRNPIERSKFEKEQQQRTDAQNQLTSHILDSMKSESRKNRHDNLRARMNAVQREEFTNQEGKTETIEFTLDHKDKALVEKAMTRSRKRKAKEKKSNVMLAANHYNSSNLDEIK